MDTLVFFWTFLTISMVPRTGGYFSQDRLGGTYAEVLEQQVYLSGKRLSVDGPPVSFPLCQYSCTRDIALLHLVHKTPQYR